MIIVPDCPPRKTRSIRRDEGSYGRREGPGWGSSFVFTGVHRFVDQVVVNDSFGYHFCRSERHAVRVPSEVSPEEMRLVPDLGLLEVNLTPRQVPSIPSNPSEFGENWSEGSSILPLLL